MTTATKELNREYVARHRKRARIGPRLLQVLVSKDELDQLEVLGHLDPNRRGEALDEAEAVEAGLRAYLQLRGKIA